MIRSHSLRALAAFAALSISLAACGGGGSAPSAPSASGFTPVGSIPNALLVPHWDQAILNGATYVGPLQGGMLSVNVLVHQQNAQGLDAYASEVNDPHSGVYRQWLTPQQIADRFGASQADYQKAADYFHNQGLVVGAWPQRMLITVSGAQSTMERAFGTTFGRFSRDGQTFVAPRSTPHFLSVIPVDAVGKLVSYQPMHSYLINPPRAGSDVNLGYSPQVVRAAFDLNGAYAKNYNGSGVTIGIIGTGPIDTANGDATTACNTGGATTGPQGDNDLNAFAKLWSASVANVYEQCVTGNGVAAGLQNSGIPTPSANPTPLPPNATPAPLNNAFPYSDAFASPPPVTGSCFGTLPTCNGEDGEAQLDVQQAASLAPGATVDFYLAYNAADCNTNYPTPCATSGTNAGVPLIGIAEADPEIQQVIADNTADVISMSYGGGEIQQFPNGATSYNTSFYHLEFAELAAEGIAAFASSGDSGSAECLAAGGGYQPQVCVSYPSGDPYVTSVGGVTAYISGLGQFEAPLLAWGISTSGYSGYGGTSATGGGTSTFMPAPAWQKSAISPAPSMREQPDVSMIGDPSTGVTFVTNSRFAGGPGVVGGTSVASPEMAAIWALVLSACKANPGSGMCPASGTGHYWRLGDAAPVLYKIYSGGASLPYANVFYDVQYGSNEMQSNGGLPSVPVPGAQAMPGYDETTGVGTPFAGHLIQAIANVTVP